MVGKEPIIASASPRGYLDRIQQLGHVVIKVRDRDRAEQFYSGVLGLPIVARRDNPPMTFFSLGNHHDFATLAVGEDGPNWPQTFRVCSTSRSASADRSKT